MPEQPRGAQGRTDCDATIEDLARMLAADYAANRRKTAVRVNETFRLHLAPFFGDLAIPMIARLSPLYRDSRIGEGAAPATVRLELMHLTRAMKLAVMHGLIDHRPPLARITVRNVRQAMIPEAKVDGLLAALPHEIRDLVEMLYLTGWRTTEVTTLRWSDVDLLNREICLDGALAKNGKPRIFPFSLYPRLERLLLRRRKKTLDVEALLGVRVQLVFHRRGERIKRFYRSWRTACKRVGLVGFVPHDLRRLAIVAMRRAGVDDQTAMELTGHKTRSMHDRYGIVETEDLIEGTRRLSLRIEGSRSRREL